MKVKVHTDAGVCGFHTFASVSCDDGQSVTFAVTTGCEKIKRLAAALDRQGPLEAYEQMAPGGQGTLTTAACQGPPGPCLGCVVPNALFKGMQVAAGLALPKDVKIAISPEG